MCSSLTFSDSAGSVQSQSIDIIHHTPFITSAAARLKGPVEIPAQSCCVLVVLSLKEKSGMCGCFRSSVWSRSRWLEWLLQVDISFVFYFVFPSTKTHSCTKDTHPGTQRWKYGHRNWGLMPQQIFHTHYPSLIHPNPVTKRPSSKWMSHHLPSTQSTQPISSAELYEEGWRFWCVTLVTGSSKSTSRPRQSCQITHFISIWGWSISAGPARLHYPQTSCEIAIMCVQACGGNRPLCRPSAFTSQQWASYVWLNTPLRSLNTKTLK